MTRPWSEDAPPMIRPHTKPCRNLRTAKVDHRGSGTVLLWKNKRLRRSSISQKRISCEISFKLHRQLPHQHHLRYHLHCGNDPTSAEHNGIPSATHPPAPPAIAFALRERSCSYKSHWNSGDRTCTKNNWNPIDTAGAIGSWSAHDPPMIRPWCDHTRNRLATVAPQR